MKELCLKKRIYFHLRNFGNFLSKFKTCIIHVFGKENSCLRLFANVFISCVNYERISQALQHTLESMSKVCHEERM